MAPKMKTGLLALATLSSAAPNQARLKEDTTQTLLLPPQPTQANIWASVITSSASATEYLLACETAFAQPDQCDGAFTGVTLTQGPQTMAVELAGKTYRCSDEGKDAVCEIVEGDVAAKTTLGGDASSWSTAVTIVSEATAAPGPELELRKGGSGKSSGIKKGGGFGHGDDDEDDADADDDDNDDDNDDDDNDGDDDDDDWWDDDNATSTSSSSSSLPTKITDKIDDKIGDDDEDAAATLKTSYVAIAVAVAALGFAV